jgi:hypothetical protein
MIIHTKVCVECKNSKRLKQFDYCKTCKNERKNVCISCMRKKRTDYLMLHSKGEELAKVRSMDLRLKTTYGINIETYNKMFTDQNGCCKICKIHQTDLNKNLAVDHSHTTGQVRGLLCPKCNTGIGLLQEDISILAESIKYLMSFRSNF